MIDEPDKTIRCGVFTDVTSADRAVNGLLAEGFPREQISVLSSDDGKEAYFRLFEHEEPAGTHAPEAAATGGAVGAAIGGVASVGLMAAVGLPVVAAGPALVVGGAVAGGLIGAMQTRGQEKELSDFYAQALTDGKLLVAVEDPTPGHEHRLRRAEAVFRNAGAQPIPLTQKV